MKKVERIDVINNPLRPIVLTSCIQVPLDKYGNFSNSRLNFDPDGYERIIYLGNVDRDEAYSDIFACYYKSNGGLTIWRGELNDGVY